MSIILFFSLQKALYYFLKAAKAGSANAMAFIGKVCASS